MNVLIAYDNGDASPAAITPIAVLSSPSTKNVRALLPQIEKMVGEWFNQKRTEWEVPADDKTFGKLLKFRRAPEGEALLGYFPIRSTDAEDSVMVFSVPEVVVSA